LDHEVDTRREGLATHDLLANMDRDWSENWSELVRRWNSKLRVLLHFRTAELDGSVDAEDIRQETWAEAIRCFQRFDYRGPGSFYAWLAAIARNQVRHAHRRAPRRIEATHEGTDETNSGPPSLLAAIEASQTSVASRVANRDLEQVVLRVVAELPDPLREVILLRVYEGRSGREVAGLLRIHESSVSQRLKQGLERCAKLLRQMR